MTSVALGLKALRSRDCLPLEATYPPLVDGLSMRQPSDADSTSPRRRSIATSCSITIYIYLHVAHSRGGHKDLTFAIYMGYAPPPRRMRNRFSQAQGTRVCLPGESLERRGEEGPQRRRCIALLPERLSRHLEAKAAATVAAASPGSREAWPRRDERGKQGLARPSGHSVM